MGNNHLMGTGFHFGAMGMLWNWIEVVVVHTVNVLNAPELLTLEWSS